MIKYLLLAALLALAGYGLMKAWPLIAGPSLSIVSPGNNGTFPDGIVAIEGAAPRAAELTLNGALLLHKENGAFSTVLTFPAGGSILTFAATDRFGRTVTATRAIFVPFGPRTAN